MRCEKGAITENTRTMASHILEADKYLLVITGNQTPFLRTSMPLGSLSPA